MLAIVLLSCFGLAAAADASVTVRAAERRDARAPRCCCCRLADAPGAVVAKLCCGLRCRTNGNDVPATPTNGDTQRVAALEPPTVAPVSVDPPATDSVVVLLTSVERTALGTSPPPLYVSNATFLI